MDDKDSRVHNRPFIARAPMNTGVKWKNEHNGTCIFLDKQDAACSYVSVAHFAHHMASATGGYFVPIRPPCPIAAINTALPSWAITDASCKAGALDDKLDAEVCAKWTGDGVTSSMSPDATITIIGNNASNGAVSSLTDAGVIDTGLYGGHWKAPGYDVFNWDDRGVDSTRIVCDTQCRDVGDQVAKMIQDAFRSNPFTIVRDDIP